MHGSLIGARARCRAEVEARNVEALVSAGRLEDAHAAASALFTLCADAGLQARVGSFAHARDEIRVLILPLRIHEASNATHGCLRSPWGAFLLCQCACTSAGPDYDTGDHTHLTSRHSFFYISFQGGKAVRRSVVGLCHDRGDEGTRAPALLVAMQAEGISCALRAECDMCIYA